MEISIRYNNVYLFDVELGESFNMVADLKVDKYGRVEVKTGSNLSFYTDLDQLPLEVLHSISEILKKEANSGILRRINERVIRVIEKKSQDSEA